MYVKKYFFIGDIHGCAKELEKLLAKIPRRSGDEIICVGDIVNKGPDSNTAVSLLRCAGARSVMGNHDFIIKSIHDEKTRGIKQQIEIKEQHFALYNSISEENRAYLSELPLWIDIPEINALVVHAGLKGNTPLNQHSAEELTCLRILDPTTKEFVKRDRRGLP